MIANALLVGIISDTHGLLRPQALDALRGADLIIHVGDIGKGEILEPLRSLAPTFAVRGNVDKVGAPAQLPASQIVEAGPLLFYVLHDIAKLDLDPPTAGFAAVIYGHSHRPSVETRDGVLYLNPGSAGPRRFSLPVTVARVVVAGRELRPEIVTLQV
jgi:putative phosphoesterase